MKVYPWRKATIERKPGNNRRRIYVGSGEAVYYSTEVLNMFTNYFSDRIIFVCA